MGEHLRRDGVGALVPSPPATTRGLAGCGDALDLDTRNSSMRLPGGSFPEARGVDFWFRAEPLLSEPFGLLGKDRSEHHDGDISVFLMKDSGADRDVNHVYVRVQYVGNDAEDLTTFMCS